MKIWKFIWTEFSPAPKIRSSEYRAPFFQLVHVIVIRSKNTLKALNRGCNPHHSPHSTDSGLLEILKTRFKAQIRMFPTRKFTRSWRKTAFWKKNAVLMVNNEVSWWDSKLEKIAVFLSMDWKANVKFVLNGIERMFCEKYSIFEKSYEWVGKFFVWNERLETSF